MSKIILPKERTIPTSAVTEYILVSPDNCEEVPAEIIVETPVTLTVNGEPWVTFMCTPVDLEALMIGFLYNEGLIESAGEIIEARLCQAGDNVDVWLTHAVEKPLSWRRTSGCTGGVTAVETKHSEIAGSPQAVDAIIEISGLPDSSDNCLGCLTQEQICRLVDNLFDSQDLYRISGGVHTSALSDGAHIHLVAEDIGRHNTLDKITGKLLLHPLQLKDRLLLTTGRISSEMMQKAVRMGASAVISRTSPTSLSIEIAERNGVTLIGYARRTNFRVYSHPERIACGEDYRSQERT